MKTPRFVAGLWLGATITSFLAALAVLYTMTGRYLIPSAGGVRLVNDEEAIQIAKQLVDDELVEDEEEENL